VIYPGLNKFVVLMKKLILTAVALLSLQAVQAQEMKANVQVIAPSLQLTNKEILNTLQTSITQFINNRKWTDEQFEAREKIEMSVFIEVKNIVNASEFTGTMQISSTRPVFGSTYKSPVFNFNDEDMYFPYREFEPLDFQENQNVNDLTSLLAFYINIILGYDYDSFGELGGTPYFQKAQSIANLMQGKSGWNQTDGRAGRNRFTLIENLNNSRFTSLRKLNYQYHRKGLDQMSSNPENARTVLTSAIKSITDVSNLAPNNLLQRIFFTTKWSEIVEVYKPASVPEKNSIIDLLMKLDPQNTARYEKIKA
jgi:hypothetical protein